MTIFFTSDHHFGHNNIIKFCRDTRQYNSIHEMNLSYVKQWNEQVKPNDTVYHLGDLCFNNPQRYISYLHGHIKVVPGNHDRWSRKQKIQQEPPISASGHRIEILPFIHILKQNKDIIVLCHYPLLSWPHKNYNSYHCYGHTHKELSYNKGAINVGVDGTGGRLLEYKEIISIIDKARSIYEQNFQEESRY